MANPSAHQALKVLGAFAAAGATMVGGMVVSTLGEAIVRRDNSVIELIPTVVFGGVVLGLIPLFLSALAFLVARSLNLVNVIAAMVTGCALGWVCGFLIGPPAMRPWSGAVVGIAAALVWWKLYTQPTSAGAPSNTR